MFRRNNGDRMRLILKANLPALARCSQIYSRPLWPRVELEERVSLLEIQGTHESCFNS
jgi:hypothetical protein